MSRKMTPSAIRNRRVRYISNLDVDIRIRRNLISGLDELYHIIKSDYTHNSRYRLMRDASDRIRARFAYMRDRLKEYESIHKKLMLSDISIDGSADKDD